jgi:UDP-glucuronate 4-epimerase
MTILITGAAGFIGSHVSRALLDRGDSVIGFDNLNNYYDVKLKHDRLKILEHENFIFKEGDISNKQDISPIFHDHKIERVVNLAAQAGVRYSLENPQAYVSSNLIGFVNILELCRFHNINHLVYASSSSVYGMNTILPFSVSHNVDHPVSLYAATKKSNELLAHTYSHLFDLPTSGLRFFTVYGPWGRPDMAAFLFTKAILEGKPIKVFNHGKMKRDFTYIDDIVEGVIRVLDKPPLPNPLWSGIDPDPSFSSAPYKIFNIGNNQPVKLTDFIHEIESALNIEAKKEFLPIQPGDVPETYADIQALTEHVDFQPSTSIQDGISNFINWYKTYYKIK